MKLKIIIILLLSFGYTGLYGILTYNGGYQYWRVYMGGGGTKKWIPLNFRLNIISYPFEMNNSQIFYPLWIIDCSLIHKDIEY